MKSLCRFSLIALFASYIDAVIDCPHPGSGPSEPLPAGTTVDIRKARGNQVCTLNRISVVSYENNGSNTYLAPAGRSYNGRNWEASAGPYASTLKFECTSTCVVTLPVLENPSTEKFVLITYALTANRKAKVSRFLEQATFGPTRSEIKSFNRSAPLDFPKWIYDQIYKEEATLHRSYFRSRANARLSFLYDDKIAPGEKPCDSLSRWKSYAFGWEEARAGINFRISVPNNSNEWFLITDQWGYPRTEVPQKDWLPYFRDGQTFRYCSAEEKAGGLLMVQVGGKCIPLEAGNPLIQFHESLPKKWIHLPDIARFSVVDKQESEGSEMILLKNIESPVCDTIPAGGGVPVHALSGDNNTWIMHDPRVVLLSNTVERPSADGGGANMVGRPTMCSNVARSFLNSEFCEMSKDAATCAPYMDMDVKMHLTDSTISDFYRLAHRYVYVIDMPDAIGTPCVPESTSRWLKIAGTCRTTIPNAATQVTIRSLLANNRDENPNIKDVRFPSGNSYTCLTSTPKGVVIDVGSTCWQHVNDDHYNVYDLTEFASLHRVRNDTGLNTFVFISLSLSQLALFL